MDLSPLEYMMKCYPEIKEKEEMRKIIGRYGLSGKQQVSGGRGPEPWEAETAPLPFALGCSAVELTGLKEGAAVAGPSPTRPCLQTAGIPVFKDKGT